MSTTNAKIKLRTDTKANWAANDPTLLDGEVGFESDTLDFKLGHAVAWNSSAYYPRLVGGIGAAHPLPRATYPSAYVIAAGSGHNDVYTVPAGRKALLIDYIKTNPTGGGINSFPEIKISSTYYSLGNSVNEGAAGIGHNYGMSSSNLSQPIVLKAGETVSVNTDAAGLSVWMNIVEFDASSPIDRADITTWVNGANTLFTVPSGKTVLIGVCGLTANQNNPGSIIQGYTYRNGSGSSRTISSVNIVPFGGSPSSGNQFVGSNSIINGSGFAKYFHGNIAPGDFISINSDSSAAGQYAWINYLVV